METHPLLVDWQNQRHPNGNNTQCNILTQCGPFKDINDIFKEVDKTHLKFP